MANLEKLEAELLENRKKGFEIRNKIDELKTNEVLPKIKEKYEGRFWKYENMTSSEEKWWLYSFCIEVENERGGLFNSFEITPYESKCNIKTNQYFHLCQIEITREDYMKALELFNIEVKALANVL